MVYIITITKFILISYKTKLQIIFIYRIDFKSPSQASSKISSTNSNPLALP